MCACTCMCTCVYVQKYKKSKFSNTILYTRITLCKVFNNFVIYFNYSLIIIYYSKN